MVLWKSTPAQWPPNLKLPRKQNLFSQMQEDDRIATKSGTDHTQKKDYLQLVLLQILLHRGITTTSFQLTVKIDPFTPRQGLKVQLSKYECSTNKIAETHILTQNPF